MENAGKTWDRIAYGVVILGELAYAVLTIVGAVKTPPQTVGLTILEIRIIQVTVVIPYLIAWLVGIRGAIDLRRCASDMRDTVAARGFRRMGIGIAVLVIGSEAMSILGGVRMMLNPLPLSATYTAFTILNNYLYAAIALATFLLIFLGTKDLLGHGASHARERDDLLMTTVISVILACVYVLLVFSNPVRQASIDPSVPATYGLPDILIITTIVLPFLAAWFLGLLSSMRLAHSTPTEVIQWTARKPFRRFVTGILLTLFASILLQALGAVGAARLFALGIGLILVIVYSLILLQAGGYLLISSGARRLRLAFEIADKIPPDAPGSMTRSVPDVAAKPTPPPAPSILSAAIPPVRL